MPRSGDPHRLQGRRRSKNLEAIAELRALLGEKRCLGTRHMGLAPRTPITEFKKHSLLNGLDPIALTLRQEKRIRNYEAARAAEEPWLFADRA